MRVASKSMKVGSWTIYQRIKNSTPNLLDVSGVCQTDLAFLFSGWYQCGSHLYAQGARRVDQAGGSDCEFGGANVVDPAGRSPLSLVIPSSEEVRKMDRLDKFEERKRVGAKAHLRNLHGSYCAKRRMIPESVYEAICLAVKPTNDAVVNSALVVDSILDPGFDELSWQLTYARAEVALPTAKLF